MEIRTIGIVGAGTMGLGIAQVAAEAGFSVLLHDSFPQALERAQERIRGLLQRAVDKQRMEPAALEAVLARIEPVGTLAPFSGADFVVEAAPEQLELKRQIFAELDRTCCADTILASNTSSLAVTEVGALTKRPDRVVGMHFFNPATMMPLVEVVRGQATAPAVVAVTMDLASRLGKTPVEVSDTPGFIVNRVARPFYGEALRMAGEGVADPATIDACLRAVGFRMGPFELMDLVGIDINYAVTNSVYQQFFGEPRFRPHVIQAKMVQAGLLGRKTGHGFYTYDQSGAILKTDGGQVSAPAAAATSPPAGRAILIVAPSEAVAAALQGAADKAGLAAISVRWPGAGDALVAAAGSAWLALDMTAGARQAKRAVVELLDHTLPPDAILAAMAVTVPATEIAGWTHRAGRVLGLGGLPATAPGGVLEVVVPFQRGAGWAPAGTLPDSLVAAGAALAQMGLVPTPVADGAGLVAARVLACLVNEAAHALMEGVATADSIDTAMRLGVNYPKGPLAWGEAIGFDHILAVLENLYADLGDDRYRPAPLLRRLVTAGWR